MTKEKQKTIVLTTGGTAGHMNPTASLADELLHQKYKVVLITDERGKRFISKFDNKIDVYVIKAKYFKKGIFSKIGTLFNLTWGYFYAIKILLKIKPNLLVSFGGYASFPSSFAATTIKIPVVLHEQNASLGRAHRVMLPFANKMATSFHKVDGVSKFFTKKIIFTGNPISKSIEKLHKNKYPSSDNLNILITGGSQGAKLFGDIVPQAIKLLSKKEREKIVIVQQVVEADIDKVKDFYKKIKVQAEISSFFNDMDKKLKETNLFIGRAGAMTVNELMIVGRASILIPLSINKDQTANANVVADAGAGWVMNQNVFTSEKLAERISYFINNPELLKVAGNNAKEMSILGAAKNLANLVNLEVK